MNKQAVLITTSFFFIFITIQAIAKSTDNSGKPTISVTKLDINNEALHLNYEIRNDSEDDVWILAGWYQLSDNTFGMAAGLQMSEDGRTLNYKCVLQ